MTTLYSEVRNYGPAKKEVPKIFGRWMVDWDQDRDWDGDQD